MPFPAKLISQFSLFISPVWEKRQKTGVAEKTNMQRRTWGREGS
jgi:hypothetical protein